MDLGVILKLSVRFKLFNILYCAYFVINDNNNDWQTIYITEK